MCPSSVCTHYLQQCFQGNLQALRCLPNKALPSYTAICVCETLWHSMPGGLVPLSLVAVHEREVCVPQSSNSANASSSSSEFPLQVLPSSLPDAPLSAKIFTVALASLCLVLSSVFLPTTVCLPHTEVSSLCAWNWKFAPAPRDFSVQVHRLRGALPKILCSDE